MNYNGTYINLDRSPDRRQHIEAALEQVGLKDRYKRFAAMDGNPLNFPNPHLHNAQIGCFSSHYQLFADYEGSTLPLHIIEDDVVLSPPMETMLDQMLSGGALAEYDIVYTHVYVPIDIYHCRLYKNHYDALVKRAADGRIEALSFTMLDLKNVPEFAWTSSYLVNPASFGKLKTLYENELRSGARVPVDMFVRHLCHTGQIRIGCIFPFLTTVQGDVSATSTISTSFESGLTGAFYIGCDVAKNLEDAKRAMPEIASPDPHKELLLRMILSAAA